MPDHPPSIAVAFDHRVDRDDAEALAARLNLPLAKRFGDDHDLYLALSADARRELRVVRPGHPLAGGNAVCADWLKLDVTSPAGRKINQPLFRAVGVRKGQPWRPAVVDGTGGLGEDAWLLAAAGCRVVVLERSAVIHALLEDAWRRAHAARPETAERIRLIHTEAAAWLGSSTTPRGASAPDVVYLDPMFPPGRKTVEKKPMRVLRWLVGDDADAGSLLAPALRIGAPRVVVKRPRHAPFLADREPVHSHQAKALRYDVYAAPRPHPSEI